MDTTKRPTIVTAKRPHRLRSKLPTAPLKIPTIVTKARPEPEQTGNPYANAEAAERLWQELVRRVKAAKPD